MILKHSAVAMIMLQLRYQITFQIISDDLESVQMNMNLISVHISIGIFAEKPNSIPNKIVVLETDDQTDWKVEATPISFHW
jgi:hypothetical protein